MRLKDAAVALNFFHTLLLAAPVLLFIVQFYIDGRHCPSTCPAACSLPDRCMRLCLCKFSSASSASKASDSDSADADEERTADESKRGNSGSKLQHQQAHQRSSSSVTAEVDGKASSSAV